MLQQQGLVGPTQGRSRHAVEQTTLVGLSYKHTHLKAPVYTPWPLWVNGKRSRRECHCTRFAGLGQSVVVCIDKLQYMRQRLL